SIRAAYAERFGRRVDELERDAEALPDDGLEPRGDVVPGDVRDDDPLHRRAGDGSHERGDRDVDVARVRRVAARVQTPSFGRRPLDARVADVDDDGGHRIILAGSRAA